MVGSVLSAVVSLAVVPLYLRTLGLEAYGLVGLFGTMQVLFLALDLGLAPTMSREVARGHAVGQLATARDLLHTLTFAYAGVAFLIVLGTALVASTIARDWLHTHLPETEVRSAIVLMGAVCAVRWPIGLYSGVLTGTHRLAQASAIGLIMAVMAALGSLAILHWLSPTIGAFFWSQLAVALLNLAIMRAAAWRALQGSATAQFNPGAVRKVWRFALGMAVTTLVGVFTLQADKLYLSRVLALDKVALYTLAGLSTRVLALLVGPVFAVVYPRMTAQIASNDIAGVTDLYRTGTRLLAAILFPAACFVAFFARPIYSLWTSDASLAATIGPAAGWLVAATAISGIMYFPHALQLAFGHARVPLLISAAMLGTLIVLLVPFTANYGIVGAAAANAVASAINLLIGTYLTHRLMLRGLGRRWLLLDVGVPALVSVTIIELGATMLTRAGVGLWPTLIFGALLALAACIVNLSMRPGLLAAGKRLLITPPPVAVAVA